MKLWLDDIRDPAKFGKADWIWVKTAPEAINLLQVAPISEASLDHDLGLLDCGTGYDVILFLESHSQFWPEEGVRVHSANPVASKRMRTVIERHYGR